MVLCGTEDGAHSLVPARQAFSQRSYGLLFFFFFPVSFTAFFILSPVSMFPPFYTWPCSCSVPFSSFVLVVVIDWLLKYKETQVEVVTGRSHWIQLPEAAGVYEHKLSHDSSFFMEPYFPLLCFCLCLLRSSLSLIMSKSWCLSLRW